MYHKILNRIGYLVLALAIGAPTLAAEQAEELKVGPRALSRAFRTAAREASPSVVTILSFGQNMDDETSDGSTDAEDNLQIPDG
ncbi:MAG: serine protease, partial [Planctomycetaceae bacterium]